MGACAAEIPHCHGICKRPLRHGLRNVDMLRTRLFCNDGAPQPSYSSTIPALLRKGPHAIMRAKSAIVGSIVCMLASVVPASAQAPKLVKTFSDWSSYAHDDGKTKICFAVSRPKSQEPKNVSRAPAFFYISAWPKDGVKSEISIKIGYPFKKDSDVTVTVGAASFKLFTQSDRAYVSDPTQELKLIEAMKKGSSLQVQGTSERGTVTTDNYSLTGLAQAMQSLAELCQ